jgi:hypothetical protein
MKKDTKVFGFICRILYIFYFTVTYNFVIVIFKELYVTNTRFPKFSCFVVVYRSLSFQIF